MKMIKKDLVQTLHGATNLTKYEAKNMTDQFLIILRDTLMRMEEIELRGFGCFRIHRTKERQGRNPKTGEPAKIPSRWIVKFKQSKCWEIED